MLLADFSYGYDYLGKMLSLSDAATSATQSFCYDALNRLTNYAATSSCTGSGTVTVAYNEIGNITEKSDVCSSAGCYSYPSAGGAQPHAISSLSGTFNGSVNPSFSYDANGNMTSGAGRSVTYTAFNMPAQLSEGASNNLCFNYGADHQRITQDVVTACGASPVSTTSYLKDPASGALEEKTDGGSYTTVKDYFSVAGVMISVRTTVNSTVSWNHFVLDHQGSVVATTDQAGNLLCRIAYDPWGKTTASGSGCTEPNREYLGEETINSGALVNLINLNARLYDPVLARFMAPDRMGAGSFNGQELNSYSYALNSPLVYSDPTGQYCVDVGGANGFYAGFKCVDEPPPSVPPYDDGRGPTDDPGNPEGRFGGAFGGGVNDEWYGPSATYYTPTNWQPQVNAQPGAVSFAATPNKTVPPIASTGKLLLAAAEFGIGHNGGPPLASGLLAACRANPVACVALLPFLVLSRDTPSPPPNGGIAAPHGGPDHQEAIAESVKQAQSQGAANIRVNQVQTDINGNRVGDNRPDLQYDLNGVHYNLEFDNVPARAARHGDQIYANDPTSITQLHLLTSE